MITGWRIHSDYADEGIDVSINDGGAVSIKTDAGKVYFHPSDLDSIIEALTLAPAGMARSLTTR